jgi:disulfide oxidoreductase YuzD
MKSITIHGLDEEMAKLIKKRARSERKSINKIVKELLQSALGSGVSKKDNRNEFIDLFGIWTEDDEKSFAEAIKDLEEVNPVDWK